MFKCISGYSAAKSAMPLTIVAIPVAPHTKANWRKVEPAIYRSHVERSLTLLHLAT